MNTNRVKRRMIAEGGLLYSIVEEKHLIGVETADALANQHNMHCAEQLVKALENKEIHSCDQGHLTIEEVRVLPISKHSNLIICNKHFEREMRYRKEQAKTYGKENFEFPKWEDLKIYSET